ncbi:MAG: respiratory nitrate reductase subunit gamma [Flavobacteriales bacterium]|jgi:nitrate reductase gamma subunit|nr:respiratory nitrate reductase subunit gamma [Flavobacteriales bacterium]
MSDYFLFVGLPYAAFAIMLIGSILRYMDRGFTVSSLSTQFLEGKSLFWGSQPFHWGMMFLFFGHLVAFLFPASVIAFNGDPVRLLILEVTAFAFGLATLFGIIMLVIRRLTNKRVQIVTSKMDMVVFATLLTQIISGVYIAYFHRYGSTWFAASLTPYLRSIFAFNPDMSVVASMPLAVKIHVLSAFAIVGIIPFTRYMHFLVYPIAYIWRPYQKVIWNWNKNDIRKSTKLVYGKRSKNN